MWQNLKRDRNQIVKSAKQILIPRAMRNEILQNGNAILFTVFVFLVQQPRILITKWKQYLISPWEGTHVDVTIILYIVNILSYKTMFSLGRSLSSYFLLNRLDTILLVINQFIKFKWRMLLAILDRITHFSQYYKQ
jgi:hypothetical protein